MKKEEVIKMNLPQLTSKNKTKTFRSTPLKPSNNNNNSIVIQTKNNCLKTESLINTVKVHQEQNNDQNEHNLKEQEALQTNQIGVSNCITNNSKNSKSGSKYEKFKLIEINSYLTCYLCKGYLIDATTISECLHSFCRSCIIKFLQENCYCPVCEVIINKAKPCLKLDKTLQDIVYKLVPELFVNEMKRRKVFYKNERPNESIKHLSPEQRGEDTERTIFNPQDAISLSIEYISDDSSPGAIPLLSKIDTKNDSLMKRYLQCPGMCRIEVLKKFVRNKYNVDTNSYHIDVLYKRVPLPDHYTLIDIGYIYSWKRNEPMKFYFRITDLKTVSERFDYFQFQETPSVILPHKKFATVRKSTSQQPSTNNNNNNNLKKIPPTFNKLINCDDDDDNKKCETNKQNCKKLTEVTVKLNKTKQVKKSTPKCKKHKIVVSNEVASIVSDLDPKSEFFKSIELTAKSVLPVTELVNRVSPLNEVCLSQKPVSPLNSANDLSAPLNDAVLPLNDSVSAQDGGKSVNLGLKVPKPSLLLSNSNKPRNNLDLFSNRGKSVNLALKVPKPALLVVKDTLPLNDSPPIDGKSVNSDLKVQKPADSVLPQNETSLPLNEAVSPPNNLVSPPNGGKSADLGLKVPKVVLPLNASVSPPNVSGGKNVNSGLKIQKLAKIETNNLKSNQLTPSTTKSYQNQKRKNSSPHKTDEKRTKFDHSSSPPPMRILIHPKTVQNPTVRQMLSNVNQNVNHLSKIVVESSQQQVSSPKLSPCNDLQSIIDNCKINIPASLSITLNETSNEPKKSPQILPVKNFIEILKLPGQDERHEPVTSSTSPKSHSFQKIFEESIHQVGTRKEQAGNVANKRSILEIALKLQKKCDNVAVTSTVDVCEQKPNDMATLPSPESKRATLPADEQIKCDKTSTILHSPKLGLNYTVSVEAKCSPKRKRTENGSTVQLTSEMSNVGVQQQQRDGTKLKTTDSANQLLEKYNIQNLAQLTASFGGGGAGVGGVTSGLNAFQHAMFLNHIKQQNWLNAAALANGGGSGGNGGDFQKYLQGLNAKSSSNKLIKEK